jgi:ribosomal protein L16
MIVFIPRKLYYKKFQKSKGYHTKCFKKYLPKIGSFGLKAKCAFLLNFKHIEMFRILLVRQLKLYIKKPKIKINAHPILAISKKASGLRMGKGKASIKYWVYFVKQGKIIFELSPKIPEPVGISVLKLAIKKFPNKLKWICYKLPLQLKNDQNFFGKEKNKGK